MRKNKVVIEQLKVRLKALPLAYFCAVSLISLVIVLSLPVTMFANKKCDENCIELVATGEANTLSYGTEVWIQQITVDNEPIKLSEVVLNEGWHITDDSSAIYCNTTIGVEFQHLVLGPFPAESVVDFTLGTHQWSGYIKFIYPDGEHVADLYSDIESTTSRYFELPPAHVNYGGMNVVDWILLLSEYLAIFICTFGVILVLSQNINLFFTISYIAICIVLWCCSEYISPAKSVLLFIGFLSCLSFSSVIKNIVSPLLIPYYRQGKYFIRVILICFYSAFASFGYRLFLS